MLVTKARVVVEKPEYQSRNDWVLQAAHHAEPVIAFDVASLLGVVFDFLHGDLQLELRENVRPLGTGDRPVRLMMNDDPERGLFRWKAFGLQGSATTQDVAGLVVPDVSIADVGTTVVFDFLEHPIRYREPKLCELVLEVPERGRETKERPKSAVVQVRVERLAVFGLNTEFHAKEESLQRPVVAHHHDGGFTSKRGLVVVL